MTTDIRTVVYPLPVTIKAYTAVVNGFYTIVINENLSYEEQRKAYAHEIEHINNDDFYKSQNVSNIEANSH